MNKVIIINLNGNAYQLEEAGYEALRAYLDTAASRLAGNPDRDEILADIEQAIADKFRALMGASKTVVSTKEAEAVIAEMGPVEDASEGSASGAAAAGKPEPGAAAPGVGAGPARRLYRIRDGAMIAGVCKGLSAYLGIDVVFIRVMFLVSLFFWGFGAIIYLIMALTIPSAETPAEKTAAHGVAATAQEFIRRAREGYYGGFKAFGDRRAYRAWKRNFRHEMRAWRQDFRQQMRANTEEWSANWRRHWAEHACPPGPAVWIVAPVVRLITTLISVACILALISLLATGTVFGILLPLAIPVWAGLILIIFAFAIVAMPFKIMRHAMYYRLGYDPVFAGWLHFWNLVAALGFLAVLGWFAYHHSGQVHEAIRNLPHEAHRAADAVREWWSRP